MVEKILTIVFFVLATLATFVAYYFNTRAKLEAAIAKAEAEMADPALFAKNPDRFAKLASASEKDRAALAKAEDEWLELEMLRAEMEG